MQIKYFDSIKSTQISLKSYIKTNKYCLPLAFYTKHQTDGIGSRDNKWIGKKGNLFFSFVIKKSLLPDDLLMQSASIYFSYIFKEILSEFGSKCILKWPNDLYIKDKKISGTITTVTDDLIFCGIGLNIIDVSSNFGYLDINVDIKQLLNKYFNALEKYPSWKQIFSKYEVEFQNNKELKTQNILLKNTILQKDGSLLVDGKKVFSLR